MHDLELTFLVNQRLAVAAHERVGNAIFQTDMTSLSGRIWELISLK